MFVGPVESVVYLESKTNGGGGMNNKRWDWINSVDQDHILKAFMWHIRGFLFYFIIKYLEEDFQQILFFIRLLW